MLIEKKLKRSISIETICIYESLFEITITATLIRLNRDRYNQGPFVFDEINVKVFIADLLKLRFDTSYVNGSGRKEIHSIQGHFQNTPQTFLLKTV